SRSTWRSPRSRSRAGSRSGPARRRRSRARRPRTNESSFEPMRGRPRAALVVSRMRSVELEIAEGDITQLEVDAIANAANDHLWMGAGVAGAIKRAGGEEIEREA